MALIVLLSTLFSCKNGTSCGNSAASDVGVPFVWLPQSPRRAPPPPPHAGCGVSISILAADPFVFLKVFPSAHAGHCKVAAAGSPSGPGELWEITNATYRNLQLDMQFCVDVSYPMPVPLYVKSSIGAQSLATNYEDYTPGPPAASAFAIPDGCKC